MVCGLVGVQLAPYAPLASHSAAELTAQQVSDTVRNLRDLPEFRRELAAPDAWSTRPAADLLTGLRGKDVLVVFVESYGRVAVEGSRSRRRSTRCSDAGTAGLRRRRLLLAQRVPDLADVRRDQLAGALHPAVRSLGRQPAALRPAARRSDRLHPGRGLRTAPAGGRSPTSRPTASPGRRAAPSTATTRIYDSPHVGYAGPTFGYARDARPVHARGVPAPRARRPDQPPVMAEIDLVSSHAPWTPLPHLLPLGPGRRRLGLRRHARRGGEPASVSGIPTGCGRPTAQSIAVLARAP